MRNRFYDAIFIFCCFIALSLTGAELAAQQRPAITGIAFARVYATDTGASEAFYRTLGFEPQQSTLATGSMQRFPVNALQWIEVVPLPSPAPQSRLAAVGLMTRDAAAMEKYLRSKSIPIDQPLKHGELSVLDPEGHRIVFVQAGSQQLGKPSDHATSHRMIHAGFVVQDHTAEDHFFREVLGFKPYWFGGKTETSGDYMSLQVPEGTDWLEYMMNVSPNSSPKTQGVMGHFSLGIAHMQDAVEGLAANHCVGPTCSKTQMGRDGKVQMNVYDPDLTRIEYMEFQPSGTPCCSPFTGVHPTEQESR
jgi:catechol 2,3-dioxygenase-like lactoylglutathione lyase family enzyme